MNQNYPGDQFDNKNSCNDPRIISDSQQNTADDLEQRNCPRGVKTQWKTARSQKSAKIVNGSVSDPGRSVYKHQKSKNYAQKQKSC